MASRKALASLAQACSVRTTTPIKLRAIATTPTPTTTTTTTTTGRIALRQCHSSSRTFVTRRAAITRPAAVQYKSATERKTYSTDSPAPPGGAEEKPSKIWDFEAIQKLISSPSSSSVTIIDSREPSELQETGRIPGAINIPVKSAADSFFISDEEFEDHYGFPRPSKDAELVFYCKAGVRSRAAAGLAKHAGWEKVGEYPGSWLDWFEKGGKIER